MVIYILTKLGADMLIFVNAKVLTRNVWTDGHRRTVSDHNSSLSTPCSGELKRCSFDHDSENIPILEGDVINVRTEKNYSEFSYSEIGRTISYLFIILLEPL